MELPDNATDKEYIEYLKHIAKELGWPRQEVLKCFLEYKKFQRDNKTN